MHSFYLAPEHLEVVVVSGPDAAKFLQGQLTCDVDALLPGNFTWGAACNNKGRVFACFLLVRHEDAYHLVFTKGLGQLFNTSLKKYLPFYKCTLALAPESPVCLGAAGSAAAAVLAERFGELPTEHSCKTLADGWICTLSAEHQQYLLCTTPVQHAAALSTLSAATAQADLEAWQALGMLQGRFPFTPDDADKYTPQDLHLDRHGYVSFTKGCYTGQEIVARMHYRGKLKRQLYLLGLDQPDAEAVRSGLEVHAETGAALGHTLAHARTAQGDLLALVQLPVQADDGLPQLKTATGQALTVKPF